MYIYIYWKLRTYPDATNPKPASQSPSNWEHWLPVPTCSPPPITAATAPLCECFPGCIWSLMSSLSPPPCGCSPILLYSKIPGGSPWYPGPGRPPTQAWPWTSFITAGLHHSSAPYEFPLTLWGLSTVASPYTLVWMLTLLGPTQWLSELLRQEGKRRGSSCLLLLLFC
jgi:hypothetical protein